MSSLYSFTLDEFKKYLNKIFEHPANLKNGDQKTVLLEFELTIERLLRAENRNARFFANNVN